MSLKSKIVQKLLKERVKREVNKGVDKLMDKIFKLLKSKTVWGSILLGGLTAAVDAGIPVPHYFIPLAASLLGIGVADKAQKLIDALKK